MPFRGRLPRARPRARGGDAADPQGSVEDEREPGRHRENKKPQGVGYWVAYLITRARTVETSSRVALGTCAWSQAGAAETEVGAGSLPIQPGRPGSGSLLSLVVEEFGDALGSSSGWWETEVPPPPLAPATCQRGHSLPDEVSRIARRGLVE